MNSRRMDRKLATAPDTWGAAMLVPESSTYTAVRPGAGALPPGKALTSAFPGGQAPPPGRTAVYVEDSGTSMAAPHVSGAVANFLSIRREFIGRPDEVKRIFQESATSLGRERYFQGHGLVDLMRAIQLI